MTVAAGYDSRISAPVLLSGVEEGVTDGGDDVIVTGLSSTPSMFMLLQEKIFRRCAGRIGDDHRFASALQSERTEIFTKESGLEAEDVKEILEIAGKEYVPVDAQSRGVIEKKSYMEKYAADLVKKCGRHAAKIVRFRAKDSCGRGRRRGRILCGKVLVPLGADMTGSQF